MERSGFSTLSPKVEHDELGMVSLFRVFTNRLVEICVNKNKWFGFCTRVSKDQVDLMAMTIDAGRDFPSKLSAQATIEYPECTYRAAVYKYLLREFMCYYEAPTVYRNNVTGGFNDSYNKFIATANLYVVAAWLGISYEEARMSYGSRLSGIEDFSEESGLCPYLKLYVTKDGVRKVTKPRKDLDLSEKGVRVVPVFALKKGIELLFKKASQDFYDVTFVKDSGQTRTVNICFNFNKLNEVYSDKGKLMEQFGQQYQGDFMNVKTLERGYIRVIEVGTSLNSGATRSINFARIIGIKQNKPDTTFINTDLGLVLDAFVHGINSVNVNVRDIVEMLEVFNVGQSRKVAGREIANVQDLEDWARAQEMLLSTPFTKQLALFMMGNPQWFNGYTGDDSCNVDTSPREGAPEGSDSNEEPNGFDFDLEFDL